MQVSKEEILHIAKLASLNIQEDEVEEYRANLEDILNFVSVLETVNTDGAEETVGTQNRTNVFRKDEIKEFQDKELLLQNAPAEENGMFKIPKVIN